MPIIIVCLFENLFKNISLKCIRLFKLTPAKAPSGKIKILFFEISGLLNSTNSSIIIFSLFCSKNLSIDIYKGKTGSFRLWNNQLRQPILMTTHNAVIMKMPSEKFMHKKKVRIGLFSSVVPDYHFKFKKMDRTRYAYDFLTLFTDQMTVLNMADDICFT